MRARPSGHARTRGTALILVLWLIVLLTALVGGFAMAARTEHLQGRVMVRGVVAANAARAGLEYAMTRLALPDQRLQWRPDGRPYQWRYAGAAIEVRVTDENGKIDLNQADPQLLAALIQKAGVDAAVASRLAGAIVDWRDTDTLTQPAGGGEDADYAAAGLPYGAKDAEFEGVAELEQVIGMTPALFARIEPHLTVYSGRSRPDPAFASAEVLDAMGLNGADIVAQRRGAGDGAPQAGMAGVGSGTYSIQSRARLADGRQSVLRAVVRVGGGGLPGMAYLPLRWEEGSSPR
ncbi:general secretion pathway protein GspK [Lysobacter sp. LF1]|uniref:Type II secretion system protein K n=1 Tax=Lysobacter stagni TaxID=3045172 RepID=A0ABT6XF61_9GAMM|nr:general secretion pathway protein GspK [Lysobacter sp. LF1]MDI9238777.1 general secretion pathway protein GspK [Lysobacter sp. LF1]